MTRGIARHLNEMSDEEAARALRRCCASKRWIDRMLGERPFDSDEELKRRSETIWWDLDPADWMEAFAAHPRIGDRTEGFSAAEQSGMASATRELTARIRDGNQRYERKFGHVFLICATGLEAGQMASALRERLANDAETELRNAAAEQAKITRLRLEKLVNA